MEEAVVAFVLKRGALVARGQKEAADKQLNTTNTAASQYGKQANQLFSALEPQYEQETRSQGYDPATKAAMTSSGMGAIGANIGGTQEDVARRAARTRNPAGVAELTDALSRNKALASGTEASNLQKQFADYENEQRQRGLRSEEHTSELQSPVHLVCRLLLEKKKNNTKRKRHHKNN